MTEHDDIRRALEELSSHPPHRDRKRAVHERIAVAHRRRQVSGGVAASVITLLAGIAFTSLSPGDREPGGDVLMSQSAIVTPEVEPEPTPSASPRVVADATAPAPARSTTTQVAPATIAAAKPSSAAPRVESEVVAAPRTTTRTITQTPSTVTVAATTATTATTAAATPRATAKPASSTPSATPSSTPTSAEKLTAEIAATVLADGSAAPETVVTVRVRGQIYGSIENVDVWYTKVHRDGYTDSQSRSCVTRDAVLREVNEEFTFRTRYRSAGAHQIDAVVTTINAQCTRVESRPQWQFSANVTIPTGSSLTNGVKPVAVAVSTPQVQGSRITLTASADDPDGHINGFTVNWGTGQAEAYPGGNAANCSATENAGMFWPRSAGSGTFTSPLLPPGSYTVTVTAIATGCDGTAAQTATSVITVVVPGATTTAPAANPSASASASASATPAATATATP